jgi:hypothetical protein
MKSKHHCPICGSEMDITTASATYQWNKGLPKDFCNKEWEYSSCDRCFNKREKEREACEEENKNINYIDDVFCFAYFHDNIYTWSSKQNGWVNLRLVLNPSRRDSLGAFKLEKEKNSN